MITWLYIAALTGVGSGVPESSAWGGYAPAASWEAHRPESSWRGYAPDAWWKVAPRLGPLTRNAPAGSPVASRGGEAGVGRGVASVGWGLVAAP